MAPRGQRFTHIPHWIQTSEWMMISFVDRLKSMAGEVFRFPINFLLVSVTGQSFIHGRPHEL